MNKSDPEDAGAFIPRLVRGIQVCLPWTLGTTIMVPLVLLYLHPSCPWVVSFNTVPPLLVLVFGSVYLLFVLTTTARSKRFLRHVVLSATLLGLYLMFRAHPLGDYCTWRFIATTDKLYVSELLSNVLYRVVYLQIGTMGLNYIAPIFGFFTAMAYFTLCDRLFLRGSQPHSGARKRFIYLYYLGSGFHLLFFFYYNEVSQLATPFLLLFILFLYDYCRIDNEDREQSRLRSRLVPAAAFLTIACLIHAEYLVLTPSLPLAILMRCGKEHQYRRMMLEFLTVAVLFAGTVLAVVSGLWVLGFEMVPGHWVGERGTEFIPLNRFWPEKVLEVGNILVLTSPVVFAFPVLIVVFRTSLRRYLQPSSTAWILQVLALGCVVFIYIWYFDLQFPCDYDLMVSIMIPLNIALLQFLMADFETKLWKVCLRWGVVITGIALTWMLMSSLLLSDAGRYEQVSDARQNRSGPILTITREAEDNLTITLDNLPAEFEKGWVVWSFTTHLPFGSGILYGVEYDLLALSCLHQARKPGNIFHFPKHDEPKFPNVPSRLPPDFVKDLEGATLDAVALFAIKSRVISASNVVRISVRKDRPGLKDGKKMEKEGPHVLESKRPIIVAHRGLTTRAPENTLAAVQAAIDLGVDGVEVDLQVTADGKVVVFHDADLARLTGREGKVQEYTLTELEQMQCVDAVTGKITPEKIPGLDAFLDRFGGKCILFLEMKTPEGPHAARLLKELAEKVGAALTRRELFDSTFVSSLDGSILEVLGKSHPKVRSVLEFFPAMKVLDGLPDNIPRSLPVTKWIGPNYRWITRERVRWARNHYEGISTFTPDILEDHIRLMEYGVDLIQTNAPRLALLCRENKMNRAKLRKLHDDSGRVITSRWPEPTRSFRGKLHEGGLLDVDYPGDKVLAFSVRAEAGEINFVRMMVERGKEKKKDGKVSIAVLEEGEMPSPGLALVPVDKVFERGHSSLRPHVMFLPMPETGQCEVSVTFITNSRTQSLFISVGTDIPGRLKLRDLKTGVIDD